MSLLARLRQICETESARFVMVDIDDLREATAAISRMETMTYEYECTACRHQWEAEQKITAEPLKSCPSCLEDTAKRLVSGGTGTHLKGEGWFKTGGY